MYVYNIVLDVLPLLTRKLIILLLFFNFGKESHLFRT